MGWSGAFVLFFQLIDLLMSLSFLSISILAFFVPLLHVVVLFLFFSCNTSLAFSSFTHIEATLFTFFIRVYLMNVSSLASCVARWHIFCICTIQSLLLHDIAGSKLSLALRAGCGLP
jgi:hypothetical protein